MALRESVNFVEVKYREYRPPDRLAEWVECLWTGEIDEPVTAAPVRPDGCIDIVYSRRDGLRVVGTMTVVQRFSHEPGTFHCGIRFLSGMAREFVKIPAGELTDRHMPLASPLITQLEDAETASEAVHILASALPLPPASKTPVQRAIAALTRTNGVADIDFIAGQANFSPRHFRRLCLDESGLTPKHLCRILRFREALRLSQCARPDWADIALSAGYFDQSHMIRDFRELAGETPMAVFSNRPTVSAG